jgi:hypothetical protein
MPVNREVLTGGTSELGIVTEGKQNTLPPDVLGEVICGVHVFIVADQMLTKVRSYLNDPMSLSMAFTVVDPLYVPG